jgi:hypothetical protein
MAEPENGTSSGRGPDFTPRSTMGQAHQQHDTRTFLLVVFARLARSPGIDPLEHLLGTTAQLLSRYAGDELAKDLSHRRRLLEQRTVPDRKIATDHAAVAVDQAVADAVHVLGNVHGPGDGSRVRQCIRRFSGARWMRQYDSLRLTVQETTSAIGLLAANRSRETDRYVGLRP